jgi:hypothetical protein
MLLYTYMYAVFNIDKQHLSGIMNGRQTCRKPEGTLP